MHRFIYLVILVVGIILLLLVQWNSQISLSRELAAYRAESADEIKLDAQQIEQTFDSIYRAARTIARLPGVQSIEWEELYSTMDRSGSVLDDNTRLTVQEIYNALAFDVSVSELYIVPANLDPDGLDPDGNAPREPMITFDEFIVGRNGSESDHHHHVHGEMEEVEIFEYRLMREQLDWMIANYPTSERIIALDYPAISGPPVITCDNTRFDLDEPDDDDRAGLVLSVPIFDSENQLRGGVSVVILTNALSDLLRTGDQAILNIAHDYTVTHEIPGHWQQFSASGIRAEPDDSVLFSSLVNLTTADRKGIWQLWAGYPDEKFWSRNDVNATIHARTIGFVAVIILSLGAAVGTMIVLSAYKRIAVANTSLEETVAKRTADLLVSRDTAVHSLEREKDAMAEKEHALVILEKLASTDKLTGLPNRAVFLDRLQQMLRSSRHGEGKFAVLFFDFDRFKVVNDSLGHDVGDALLCSIAEIFRRELRDDDTAARFGGDEFVVLLGSLSDWPDAKMKADRLLNAFAEPHIIDENLIVSTASIGLVTNQYSYKNPLEMIRDADAAMYQAKENGKAQVVVFDKVMHANAMERLQIETDLRTALANNEFKLAYQPIFDLASGKVKGIEALLRWYHPTRGLVNPNDFISIAEDTGLINDIGKWVLWTAVSFLDDLNKRLDGACPQLSINVNVSKRQLLDAGFYEDLIACQQEFGMLNGELQLEITESVIVDSRNNIISLLERIRTHNIHIAMDDFGTGVSSLSSLHAFPIDVLKIDQSFILPLNGDRSLLAVVSSIANLAENLGILTVAEGIENEEVVGVLQSVGCTWGQGYHFARPMPQEDVEAFVRENYSTKRAA